MTKTVTKEIDKALKVLKSGGTILYPTDTVWGIGCDATNAEAVEKISLLKKRAKSKGFIILVDGVDMLRKYVKKIPKPLQRLMITSYSPVTIIYPRVMVRLPSAPLGTSRSPQTKIAGNIMAEDGSVGIRITKDEFCRKLLGIFEKPIVSTSANISGEAVPGSFSEISEPILSSVDYIVNLRKKEKNKFQPSKIIRFAKGGKFEIVRK